MTRQEELIEAWCKYRGKCSTEILHALAFALRWCDQHPRLISVEDELPRCYIPYNNWDGTPSDVLESEKVIALLSDGTICIATFNQNLDVDTDKPTGSPYWFDEGHPEDGDRIGGEVTHWMPLPQQPEHIAGISNKTACPDCFVAQYPPCGKGIPCCKCHEEGCNSRQPCPKKGGEQ